MLTRRQQTALIIVGGLCAVGCIATVWVVAHSMGYGVVSHPAASVASQANRTPPPEPASAPTKGPVPYDLKGDRLGMALDDFRARYHRVIRDGSRTIELPICSDSRSAAERERRPDAMLMEEAWHPKAGIVGAMVSDTLRGSNPTLAGYETSSHIFQFIDGKLYQIIETFNQGGYDTIERAMTATYGNPSIIADAPVQNAFGASFPNRVCRWENGVSEIVLMERFGDIDTSVLILKHTRLSELVEQRRKVFDRPGL